MSETDLSKLMDSELLWRASHEASYSSKSLGKVPFSLSFGIEEIDRNIPSQGAAPGSLHEFICDWETKEKISPSSCALLFGALSRNILASFFAASDAHKWNKALSFPYQLVFIGKSAWVSPFVLNELLTFKGEDKCYYTFLHRALFLNPPHESLTLWTIETALRSPAVALVVAECPHVSFAASRRLALAAQAGNSIGLFLRDKNAKHSFSSAASRWCLHFEPSISSAPLWKLELLKVKGALPEKRSWLVTVFQEYSEYENKAVPLTLFPDMVSRSRPEETAADSYFSEKLLSTAA